MFMICFTIEQTELLTTGNEANQLFSTSHSKSAISASTIKRFHQIRSEWNIREVTELVHKEGVREKLSVER